LQDNASDLQPRNHLYVTAGLHELGFSFPLNTAELSEGYHTLTAVAYEGSHLRTQTHAAVAVQVRNSPLSAAVIVNPNEATIPLNGVCSVRVAANAADISRITLHSTGGPLGSIGNSPTASYEVSGRSLGSGLHPLYALVETRSGGEYRTDVRWIRITP
jgi:hypothetical protein